MLVPFALCGTSNGCKMPEIQGHSESAFRSDRNNMNAESILDVDLVRRFNGGDESAFGEIMNRHKTRIFAAAMALLRQPCGRRGDHPGHLRARAPGLLGIPGDSSVATWLHRIAVNLARNRYWYFFRRRRHATLSLDAALGADGDDTFSDLLSPPDPGSLARKARGTSSWSRGDLHGEARALAPPNPGDAQRPRPLLRGDRSGARDQRRDREEPDRPGPRAPAQAACRGMPGVLARERPGGVVRAGGARAGRR
jgi:hypothetical protein